MTDSPWHMQIENSILVCVDPCGESDYIITLALVYLFVGYLIWAWNHE